MYLTCGRYADGDLNRFSEEEVVDLEVMVYASWSASRHYIKQLNTSKSTGLTVTFTANCLNPPAGMWPNSGNRYYVENVRSGVDTPGRCSSPIKQILDYRATLLIYVDLFFTKV